MGEAKIDKLIASVESLTETVIDTNTKITDVNERISRTELKLDAKIQNLDAIVTSFENDLEYYYKVFEDCKATCSTFEHKIKDIENDNLIYK